jgi:hypothetical protein
MLCSVPEVLVDQRGLQRVQKFSLQELFGTLHLGSSVHLAGGDSKAIIGVATNGTETILQLVYSCAGPQTFKIRACVFHRLNPPTQGAANLCLYGK